MRPQGDSQRTASARHLDGSLHSHAIPDKVCLLFVSCLSFSFFGNLVSDFSNSSNNNIPNLPLVSVQKSNHVWTEKFKNLEFNGRTDINLLTRSTNPHTELTSCSPCSSCVIWVPCPEKPLILHDQQLDPDLEDILARSEFDRQSRHICASQLLLPFGRKEGLLR